MELSLVFKHTTLVKIMEFNAFYNPQARQAFQWALDENDRVKASKLVKSAMKMEANTRKHSTHGANQGGTCPIPAFPRPKPPVKHNTD